MATRNDFKTFARQAKVVIKGLPKMIGKVALVEASDNFRRQGSENEAGQFVPWAPRKAQPRGRRGPRGGGGAGIRGRAVLVQTGRLRRSPRIVSTTGSSVTIGTDVPYGQPLQEGGPHLPARPFLTFGPTSRQLVIRKAAAELSKLL
jgi:phage gpG-like protein